jgi:alpha-L-rhamnosidase
MIENNKTKAGILEPLGTDRPIFPALFTGKGRDEYKVEPVSGLEIEPAKSIILDWGRKRTGWLHMAGKGSFLLELASDLEIFKLYDSQTDSENGFIGDTRPSFCGAKSRRKVEISANCKSISSASDTLRFARLTNNTPETTRIDQIKLIPSEFPSQPLGKFQCSSKILNTGWQMGIDTLHLCTQPGDQSNVPVFAPFGNGYVQWDGCRRDREIWGGDLRPSALAWYYNFEDQSPIANSLYMVMNAQHCGCSEHGLFPGSGSTHQTFYEWAFWEVTCFWEYLFHTGDKKLVKFASMAMPLFLEWCENKFAEDPNGWIKTSICWMYTFNYPQQVLPGLQIAAIIGLRALERIFALLNNEHCRQRTSSIISRIHSRFHDEFMDKELGAYTFLTKGKSHSDLCTNAWAILADVVEPNDRKALLQRIKELHWTPAGSINVAPPMEQKCFHNNTVWPYANAYEVTSRFHCGDTDGALEVFKRYIKNICSTGHNTLFEMINIDGSLPINYDDGNTLSFCHCWASLASWALQRYLLGAAPHSVGWETFSFEPLESPLEWITGSVVTPHGLIDIEVDNSNGWRKAKVIYPKSIKYINKSRDCKVEFISR